MTYESRLHSLQTRPASMIAGNVASWNEGHKHARQDAAVIGREADAELTRLLAALDAMTAERDAARAKALEDAAQVADECERQNGPLSTKFLPDTYRKGLEAGSQAIAAAIRAMIEQTPKASTAATRQEDKG